MKLSQTTVDVENLADEHQKVTENTTKSVEDDDRHSITTTRPLNPEAAEDVAIYPPVVENLEQSSIHRHGQLNNKEDDEGTKKQDGKHREGIRPRIVFLEPERTQGQFRSRGALTDDEMLHAPPGEEATPQVPFDRHDNADGCVPMEWTEKSYPNCNAIHEIDLLRSAGRDVGKRRRVDHEDLLFFLGHGSLRDAWQLNRESSHDSVTLKSLRMNHKFTLGSYEMHRRDAVALERLKHSPFVIDVYGYCANSALNELADFPHGLNLLASLDGRLYGRSGSTIKLLKLRLAASVAVGLAHVHESSVVHRDINAANIVLVKGGKPKWNDFNAANFLRIDPKTNRTCGFVHTHARQPWWRAPEELGEPHPGSKSNSTSVMLTEKVDVYSLGNVLFHIMTGIDPRGQMNEKREGKVRRQVLRGELPPLPLRFIKDQDKISKVFRKAMRMCFEKRPEKRASARQVAELLTDTLHELRHYPRNGKQQRRNQPPRNRTFGSTIS